MEHQYNAIEYNRAMRIPVAPFPIFVLLAKQLSQFEANDEAASGGKAGSVRPNAPIPEHLRMQSRFLHPYSQTQPNKRGPFVKHDLLIKVLKALFPTVGAFVIRIGLMHG